MSESFVPPERVASAARRGLRLREKVKAGTDVGVARARDLSNRRPVSLDVIGRMVSFFARHGAQKPANIGTDASPTPWLVAWLLWGGDAGRDWAEGVWRRKGDEQQASRMGLARHAAPQAWSREAPPAPAGTVFSNPKGLHPGTAFRTFTADAPVRDAETGELLGCFSADILREMAKVFEARAAIGESAPRIDFNHGPMRGKDPTIYGEAIACYVADDGERGPGLYLVPGWTDYGAKFAKRHETPDGKSSVLANSPQFRIGPVYASTEGGADGPGILLGMAELRGVALTNEPVQSEATIDTVRFSRGADTAYAAEEVSNMDPEQEAASGGEDMAEVKATIAQLAEQVGKLGQVVAAISAKLDGDGEAIVVEASEAAMAAVEDVTAEAVEEVRAAAEQQMAALEPEEVAEVDEAMGEEIKALSRRGVTNARRQKAWARRGELARSIQSQREIKALSREVATLKAVALDAECDAEMVRLRGIGMAPADEAFARAQWHAKQREGQAWSKANAGVPHAFDRFVGDLKRNPRVPMGVRGVAGDDVVNPVSIAGVKAWAKENGKDFDKDPASTFSAWERATGHNYKEIRQ
jgi:hypothetical protein